MDLPELFDRFPDEDSAASGLKKYAGRTVSATALFARKNALTT